MNRLLFLSRRPGTEPQDVAVERNQVAVQRPASASIRLATLLASLLLWSSHLPAQVAEAWTTQIPEGRGAPIDLAVQPTGHLQLFGWGGPTDSTTVKLDPNGVFLWSHDYDSNFSTLNTPIDQEVDNVGNVYVIRNSALLFKYAGDGTLLWTKLLTDTNGGAMFASRLALDASGRVLVAGSSYGSFNESDFLTLKCDTNGTVLWSSRLNAGPYDGQPLLAVDAAGNVHVAGTTTDASVGTDLVVVKYDAAGRQQWEAHYDNPAHGSDFPVAVQVDALGNVYVSGYSFANSSRPNLSRLQVVKFDAAGRLLWTAHYSGAPNEFLQATAAGLDVSGNVLVAGLAYDVIDNAGDMVLVKFDPAGIRQWAARYNGPRRSTESARALALDSSGNAYITGDSQEGSDPTSPDTTSYFTQKFDPAGNRLWSISHSATPSFYNYPGGIGLDAVGNVYIAGSYYGGFDDLGWLAVKYVPTPAPGLPAILSRPASQTVPPRSSVAFTVNASGTAPLSYQWRYSGRLINRATNATLTLNNVQFAQRGGYSVDVSNAVGVVATAEAELIVLEPPSITRQPASQTVFLGTEASFAIAVTGLEPFGYQWRHDGTDVPGATNAALTLLNLQPSDAGAYSVRVSNLAGSITSQPAVLTVSTQVMRSWAARYDGPAQAVELNPSLALDGAGLPIVAATSQGIFTDFDFATIKHNLAGTRLWASRFNSASNRADYATGLFADAAGNVYVAGHSLGEEQPALSVIKYDPAGQLLWSIATNGQWRTDLPCLITADSAGNAYVTASVMDPAAKVIIIKIGLHGQIAWSTNFNSGSDNDQQPRAIAVDPSGNICVGIREDYYCCTDFWVAKYGPDGRELWLAGYHGDEGGDGEADVLFGMSFDSAGNIYLSGVVQHYTEGEGLKKALAVVKFDGDGNRVWVGRHRSLHNRRVTPTAFAVNPSGASWFAYVSTAENNPDEGGFVEGDNEPVDSFDAVVHFGPDGHERWVSVPTTPGVGTLTRLAADNTDNAYFAGTAFRDGSGNDLAASRIDSSGSLLWTALYNGPANGQDNGNGIAVNPAGDIFVAGTSAGPAGLPDVVLVKYRENTLPGLPAIASLPTNVFTRIGSNATFTAVVIGAAPLRYQWFFNGHPLPGATSASLTILRANESEAGFYAVEVSNPVGTVRSRAARLEVLPPPVITQQPAAQETVLGGTAYFTIQAYGTEALTYQWLFRGAPIPGATNDLLLLDHVRFDQSGDYSVLLIDSAGAFESLAAPLRVHFAAFECQEWNYPGFGDVRNPMIARDPAGFLYVVGGVADTNGKIGCVTLKYTPAGQILWHARYDFPGAVEDHPSALAVDATGNVYVTGNSFLPGAPFDSDIATIKYDPQGVELWTRRYAGADGNDYAAGLAVDSAGNVVVIGESEYVEGGERGSGWVTMKYRPDGSRQWTTQRRGLIPYPLVSVGAIQIDRFDNIYVAGAASTIYRDTHPSVVKYDPDGREVWTADYEPVSGGATALALDASGNVVVAGWAVDSFGNEIITLKYNQAGNQLWAVRRRDSESRASTHRAVVVDGGGNILTTGETGGAIVTVKYDPEGRALWTAVWDAPGWVNEDGPRDLALDAAGNVYVAGIAASVRPGDFDHVTIKYDDAGNRLWVARKPGVINDVLHEGMVLDDAGDVYVVGGFGHELTTIKYCQTNAPGLPMILVPPQSQSVVVGSNVEFSVTATGSNQLSYQWRFNGEPIQRAAASTLSLSNVQPAHAGGYSVEVFNQVGAVVSAEATLSVHVPATIVSPPIDQCVMAGTEARFQVSATGESPIAIQWSFGGMEIPGATNDALPISNAQLSQVGLYTVRASNPFGSATASARLSLQPYVRQLWTRLFDNANPPPLGGSQLDDFVTVSAMDSAGNVYVAGSTSQTNTVNAPNDVFLLKYDAGGTLQWVAHHPATNNPSRRAGALAVNAADEVYFAINYSADSNAPTLLKYSASGQRLWGTRSGSDTTKIAFDSAGNAYLLQFVFSLTKVSPGGAHLWTVGRPGFANSLAVDAVGNAYVAGGAFVPASPGRPTDYLTVKYNAAGVEQWNRSFRGPVGGENAARDIAIDGAGNVVVTGFYSAPSTPPSTDSHANIATFKYDAAGNVIWFADYGAPDADDGPIAMKLDSADNVLITGYAGNFEQSGERWVTLKYGPSGGLQWARGFSLGPFPTGAPAALAVDTEGNAYVSGLVQDETLQTPIATVKYSPAGSEVWTARFQGFGSGGNSLGTYVVGVHVDAQGHVLVAGATGWPKRDALVLAYAQDSSPGAPVILSQPQNVSVPLFGAAQFSIAASNAQRFQWQFNGQDLPGENNTTLVLPAANWTQEGRYTVRVENDTYCVISRAAQLTLDVPVPILAGQGFSDGYFHVLVVATPGQYYRIEASSDLMEWTTVTTAYAAERTISFYDYASPWQPLRFYRVAQDQ